jgi:hypothetical protein
MNNLTIKNTNALQAVKTLTEVLETTIVEKDHLSHHFCRVQQHFSLNHCFLNFSNSS